MSDTPHLAVPAPYRDVIGQAAKILSPVLDAYPPDVASLILVHLISAVLRRLPGPCRKTTYAAWLIEATRIALEDAAMGETQGHG